MNEIEPDIDAEIIGSFNGRMIVAETFRRHFESAVGSITPALLSAQLWAVVGSQGDSAICETCIHDLMSLYALPAVRGQLAETRDRTMRERLEIVVGVMDEKVRMLGSSTVKAHEMKTSKLQRAIIETTLHAEYKACYTVRKMATLGISLLLNQPSHPDRSVKP